MARPWRTSGRGSLNGTNRQFSAYLVKTERATGDAVARAAFFGATASGVTGALNVTLGQLTCSGAGTVRVAGSLASTLADVTAVGTSTVIVAGALASTLSSVTSSANGAVRVAGQSASAFGAVTSTGSGTARVAGGLGITLSATACSGAGTVRIAGTVSSALAAATCVATGTAPSLVVGALSVTLGYVSGNRLSRMMDVRRSQSRLINSASSVRGMVVRPSVRAATVAFNSRGTTVPFVPE